MLHLDELNEVVHAPSLHLVDPGRRGTSASRVVGDKQLDCLLVSFDPLPQRFRLAKAGFARNVEHDHHRLDVAIFAGRAVRIRAQHANLRVCPVVLGVNLPRCRGHFTGDIGAAHSARNVLLSHTTTTRKQHHRNAHFTLGNPRAAGHPFRSVKK